MGDAHGDTSSSWHGHCEASGQQLSHRRASWTSRGVPASVTELASSKTSSPAFPLPSTSPRLRGRPASQPGHRAARPPRRPHLKVTHTHSLDPLGPSALTSSFGPSGVNQNLPASTCERESVSALRAEGHASRNIPGSSKASGKTRCLGDPGPMTLHLLIHWPLEVPSSLSQRRVPISKGLAISRSPGFLTP